MHILENHDSLKARSSKLKLLAKGIADGTQSQDIAEKFLQQKRHDK